MGYRFFPFWEIVSPHDCEMGMQGDYPGFKVTYRDEELAEHFLLTPAPSSLISSSSCGTTRSTRFP